MPAKKQAVGGCNCGGCLFAGGCSLAAANARASIKFTTPETFATAVYSPSSSFSWLSGYTGPNWDTGFFPYTLAICGAAYVRIVLVCASAGTVCYFWTAADAAGTVPMTFLQCRRGTLGGAGAACTVSGTCSPSLSFQWTDLASSVGGAHFNGHILQP